GDYWINSKNEKEFTLTFSVEDDRGTTQVRDIQVSETGPNGLQLKWEPYKADATFNGGPTLVYRPGGRPGEKFLSKLAGGTWTAQDTGETYTFQSDLRVTRNGVPGVFHFTDDSMIELLTRDGNTIATRMYRLRDAGVDRIQAVLTRDSTDHDLV